MIINGRYFVFLLINFITFLQLTYFNIKFKRVMFNSKQSHLKSTLKTGEDAVIREKKS